MNVPGSKPRAGTYTKKKKKAFEVVEDYCIRDTQASLKLCKNLVGLRPLNFYEYFQKTPPDTFDIKACAKLRLVDFFFLI